MKKILLIAICLLGAFTAKAQVSDSLNHASETFTPVEQVPEFPGGTEALITFIKKNQRTVPDTHGRVIVSFIIERDGSLTEPRVLKSVSEEADAEALRLIKKMPKWKPGMQNNNPVRVQYSMPITFN